MQALGVECMAVMPEPSGADDAADLIRTDARNLESEDWWRGHQLDGVVLYAWGAPKYRKVARAIRRAGIFLVLNQDNGGLVSPLAGWRDWVREQWILGGQGRGIRAWLRTVNLLAKGMSVGLLRTDPLRASHLRQGNVIACVSPKAAGYYRRLCRWYGGGLDRRIVVLPHAVEPGFAHAGETKRRQVVCVGRWSDHVQKRPALLMAVASLLLRNDEMVRVVIAGTPTAEMRAWHARLHDATRRRVVLAGRVGRGDLTRLMVESQLFYSPSAYESFGIAAAEALCCGCSVVAGRSVSMASFEWFVSEQSGCLSDGHSAQAHATAITDELERWEHGGRDAAGIAATWTGRLHADKVAQAILGLARDMGHHVQR